MDTGDQLTEGDAKHEDPSAATIAALTGRVYSLEQQLAALEQYLGVNRGQAPALPSAVPFAAPFATPFATPAAAATLSQPPRLVSSARPAAPFNQPLPPMPPLAAMAVKAPGKTLEERFASQLFNMIGIVALLIGASLVLKLAIDMGWVNGTARVILGLVAGTGVVLWSERFRAKGLVVFSWSMKAIGSGVLYLSLWAAFHLFHLLPAPVALALMMLVTVWNAYLAWSQDAELLAAYALVGGFLTPILLSGEVPNELFLLSYVLVLDIGTVLLLRYKPWRLLLPAALGATIFYFFGWYTSGFHMGLHQQLDVQSWETSAFALVFFLTFEVTGWRGFSRTHTPDGIAPARRDDVIIPVLLPLINVVFLGGALHAVFVDSGLTDALPWLAVALAAVYLGLMRLGKTSVSRALHLACAVVLLSAAVPLKTHGHALTVTWLLEGLALFWVANRLRTQAATDSEGAEVADRQHSVNVLEGLSLLSFLLGLGAFTDWMASSPSLAGLEREPHFWNADLASALVAAAALAGVVWIAARAHRRLVALAGLGGIAYTGLLLIGFEVANTSPGGVFQAAFINGGFATELIGLIMLAASARAATWLPAVSRRPAPSGLSDNDLLARAGVVLGNLTAIFIVVRELGAMFAGSASDSSIELKRSLAISAFLMVYGAVLLAVGFRRRSSFIRWQALILILFTILKVFLYDLSVLSAIYRILSIFGLGALLMGVSLAYQRDWFGLRAAPAEGIAASVPPEEPSGPPPPPPPPPLPPPEVTG